MSSTPLEMSVPTRPRAEWLAVLVLLLLHVTLAWLGRTYGLTTGNDDASYLMLSRELLHADYTDHYLLGAPPHSQYPPAFPAFLAVISLVAGERLAVMQAAIILCSAAALGLLYDAVRRSSGHAPLALTVLALSVVNPPLLKLSGMIMSEAPYLLLTALVIWAVIREREQPAGAAWRGWVVIAIAGAIAAALTRTFGLTILAALFITWLVERRYRRVLVLSVAGALTAGGWILWTIVAPGQVVGRSYIADATFAGESSQSMAGVLAGRLATNIPFYVTRSIPTSLPQPTLQGSAVDNVLGLVVLAVLLPVGAWVVWRQRGRIAVVYLAVSAMLLAVWTWKVTRFIAPVVPILHWVLFAGAFRIGTYRSGLRPVPYVVGGAILLTALGRDIAVVRAAGGCDRSAARTAAGCYADIQRGFFAAAEFARTATADSAVFFTMKESTFGYLSQRRVLTPSRLRSPVADSLVPELRARGVEFAVVSPLQPLDDQRVDWLLASCREWRVDREFAGMTILLRLALPGHREADACVRLQRYEREEAAERSRGMELAPG